MAISGIGNSCCSNAYEAVSPSQKNEALKKPEGNHAALAQSAGEKTISDYYAYLQKNYDCMTKGNVTISSEYLKQCSGSPAKTKELEDFLKKIPELEKQGREQLSAQNKAMGGTVTYYQQTWMIHKDGSIQSTVYSVTETGMSNAERMKKNMDERLEKQKEKREEEKAAELKKEKAAEAMMRKDRLEDARCSEFDIHI